MEQIQNVIKGGENWISFAMSRNTKGIQLWVKAISPVEEFMLNLSMERNDGMPQAAAPAVRGRVAVPNDLLRRAAQAVVDDFGAPLNNPGRDNPNEPQLEDLVTRYGRKWIPIGDNKISVYTIGNEIDSPYYTFNAIGQGFIARNGEINLSFLRFKGISSPEGLRFVIVGPMGTSDARSMLARIGTASKQFIAENIAPININLRISSTEI